MTAGSGTTGSARPYPYRLALQAKRYVENNGISGETSTQIKTRMLASGKTSFPTIIWAGRNNFASPTTVKADVAAMVAALGHQRYLVLGIINADIATEYSGGADYTTITQLNTDLAALYGARFVDVRTYLVSLYNPGIPQDVIDHGRDIPPSSLRDATAPHLNDAGYQAVADKVFQNVSVLS